LDVRHRRFRLDPLLYVGVQRYFLTFCTAARRRHFADHAAAQRVLDRIVYLAPAFNLAILAYCLMPDHAHLLVEGYREDADLLAFVHRAKQVTGYEFMERTGGRLWQPSFYDRVLRNEDATISVVRYIFENPVRAGLVGSPEEYPLLGSDRFTVREVLEATSWQP
jgi:putative transposase